MYIYCERKVNIKMDHKPYPYTIVNKLVDDRFNDNREKSYKTLDALSYKYVNGDLFETKIRDLYPRHFYNYRSKLPIDTLTVHEYFTYNIFNARYATYMQTHTTFPNNINDVLQVSNANMLKKLFHIYATYFSVEWLKKNITGKILYTRAMRAMSNDLIKDEFNIWINNVVVGPTHKVHPSNTYFKYRPVFDNIKIIEFNIVENRIIQVLHRHKSFFNGIHETLPSVNGKLLYQSIQMLPLGLPNPSSMKISKEDFNKAIQFLIVAGCIIYNINDYEKIDDWIETAEIALHDRYIVYESLFHRCYNLSMPLPYNKFVTSLYMMYSYLVYQNIYMYIYLTESIGMNYKHRIRLTVLRKRFEPRIDYLIGLEENHLSTKEFSKQIIMILLVLNSIGHITLKPETQHAITIESYNYGFSLYHNNPNMHIEPKFAYDYIRTRYPYPMHKKDFPYMVAFLIIHKEDFQFTVRFERNYEKGVSTYISKIYEQRLRIYNNKIYENELMEKMLMKSSKRLRKKVVRPPKRLRSLIQYLRRMNDVDTGYILQPLYETNINAINKAILNKNKMLNYERQGYTIFTIEVEIVNLQKLLPPPNDEIVLNHSDTNFRAFIKNIYIPYLQAMILKTSNYQEIMRLQKEKRKQYKRMLQPYNLPVQETDTDIIMSALLLSFI